MASTLCVIGTGDKPWTGALPELVHSSESRWNSDLPREPQQASLLGGLSPWRATEGACLQILLPPIILLQSLSDLETVLTSKGTGQG